MVRELVGSAESGYAWRGGRGLDPGEWKAIGGYRGKKMT